MSRVQERLPFPSTEALFDGGNEEFSSSGLARFEAFTIATPRLFAGTTELPCSVIETDIRPFGIDCRDGLSVAMVVSLAG